MTKNPIASEVPATAGYKKFSSEVNTALSDLMGQKKTDRNSVEALLNGAAADALTTHVPRAVRSADGIFFSGKVLAEYVAERLTKKLEKGCTIADPACGAGDLLLACARRFPKNQDFVSAVEKWGTQIVGIDIHESFAEAARARLTLLAANKNKNGLKDLLPAPLFSGIRQGSYFDNVAPVGEVDCVVMNPPFCTVKAPSDCNWASGTVQLAGLFVSTVLKNAKPGQEVVAVLPDVLRSGTRYARWRKEIAAASDVKHIHVHGRFDEKTDVDVFVIHLVKTTTYLPDRLVNWQKQEEDKAGEDVVRTRDYFSVSVGAYVPFRAKADDPSVTYLCVKDALPDGEVNPVGVCNFGGTLHHPPFVVIRRTSNPGDPRRVIPTLVMGSGPMAVENHLIVLRPLDKKLKSCRKLMRVLKLPYVDVWMNAAIRCRHLTTSIVKNLPLNGWK